MIDEGGGAIGAPAMPAAPAELRKALAARRRRQKDAYALLTKHLLHKEHLQHITQNFFQNGRAAYNYLDTALSQVIDQIRLDALDQQWIDLNIITDIGVNENTIKSLVVKLKARRSEMAWALLRSQPSQRMTSLGIGVGNERMLKGAVLHRPLQVMV